MDTKLLQKFYNGECSEKEVQEVVNWFASKKQKEALLEQLENEWDQFNVSGEESYAGYNPDEVLQGVQAKLKWGAMSVDNSRKNKFIDINRCYYYRIASVIILTFFSAFLLYKLLPKAPIEAHKYLVAETSAGQKRMIMLADCTKVILNAESKLSYPEKFSGNNREIILEGEAFFEVARDKSKPFRVISGALVTTVLGTSFNIQAYKDEEHIKVAVASGEVRVNQGKQEYDLVPGKEATYNTAEQTLTVKEYHQKEVLSWTEGVLYFKDASFEEVIKTLERWYGVEFEIIGGGNQDWQYTGIFQDQSLAHVLLSIGYVKGFNFHLKSDNQIVLMFRE